MNEEPNLKDTVKAFTYSDLKRAFNDGKLYGDGELPLVNEFNFTVNPELTAFNVWFDKKFNHEEN